MDPKIPSVPPTAEKLLSNWEHSVPTNEALRPAVDVFAGKDPSTEQSRHAGLRAATKEEWHDVEKNVDRLNESPEERTEREQAEQIVAKVETQIMRRNGEQLESRFGSVFFKKLIELEGEPAFQGLPKEQKYARAAELAYPELRNLCRELFPDDASQIRLLKTYASLLQDIGELPATIEEQRRALEEYAVRARLAEKEAAAPRAKPPTLATSERIANALKELNRFEQTRDASQPQQKKDVA